MAFSDFPLVSILIASPSLDLLDDRHNARFCLFHKLCSALVDAAPVFVAVALHIMENCNPVSRCVKLQTIDQCMKVCVFQCSCLPKQCVLAHSS